MKLENGYLGRTFLKYSANILLLFFITFSLYSFFYFILNNIIGIRVFGSVYRMFLYHNSHPYQYIAVASITFSIVGSIWIDKWGNSLGWKRPLSILGAIIITVLIAGIPGGILWKIHDMQAGWFPTGDRFWEDIRWGAKNGLAGGWFIVLLSFPYNIITLIISITALHKTAGTSYNRETNIPGDSER
ncbi:MAG: hypothetical protein GY754_24005 [bacterium]|nr:hypothetical protein [bacterium]